MQKRYNVWATRRSQLVSLERQLLSKGEHILDRKIYKGSQFHSNFASTEQDIFYIFRNTIIHLHQLPPPRPSPAPRFVLQSNIMHNIIPFLCLATASFTTALVSFPLTERSIGEKCSISGESGTCQKTSDCTTQGYNEAGHCPGPADIQCCVKKSCSTSSGSGICMNTENTCGGSFIAGACPGDNTVKVSHPMLHSRIMEIR